MTDKETAIVEPTVHPAVELLLARMKSNPDEFRPKGWRWHKLIEEFSGYFTEEEMVSLNEAQREISMGAFHTAVMNELLREPEAETVVLGQKRGVEGYISAATPSTWGAPINQLGGLAVPTSGQYYANNQSAMQQAADVRLAYEQRAYNAQNARPYNAEYEKLLAQQAHAQKAYPSKQPLTTPTDVTTPTRTKRWLGGLFP